MSLEDYSSNSPIHSLPQDLTGKITRCDNQYCAAGSFGDVYRCQYHHTESGVKEVAVKSFRFEFTVAEEDTGDRRSTRMIRRELGIWKRLSHPNIVPFLGIVSGFGRLGNIALVSTWMPHGTLQDFLLKYDDELMVPRRLQFLLGVASGLEYLHSLSIVHGDLTCNNVLLDDKHNARLTDFGYASLVGEIPEALAYLQASTLRPGTVRWAAPEYFSNPEEVFQCTTKSDIYSFGNVALQVLSGKPPWSEFRRDAVVVLHLAKGHKPRRPQSHPINDQHWELIEHCWSGVQERPSAEHLASSILEFLRHYPQPQAFCNTLVPLEKSSPQFTLGGFLLSPSNMKQFSPNVPEGGVSFVSSSSQLHIVPATPTSVSDDAAVDTFCQAGLSQSGSQRQAPSSPLAWDQQHIQQTEVPQSLGPIPQFQEEVTQLSPHSHFSHMGVSTLAEVHPDATNTNSRYQLPLTNFHFPSVSLRALNDYGTPSSPGSWSTPYWSQDQVSALPTLGDSTPAVSLNEVLPQQQQQQQHLSSAGPTQSPPTFSNANMRQSDSEPPPWPPRETKVSKAMLEANSRRRRHPAQFECPDCKQTFTALFSLKRHVQSHTGERPFACSIPGCTQRFFNSNDCKRHEKSKKRHKDLLEQ